MVGLVVLLVALVVSGAVALAARWRNGRFAAGAGAGDATVLTPEMIGGPLGRDVTLVQFSSAFCAPCRATRVLLSDIAGSTDGVEAVDVDAESHLDLVNRLGIVRTPTVLVLDRRGAVSTRASGLPRRDQVLAAVAAAAD
jgi:thiol-disulfide isomerase/thioredoxin